MEIKFKGKAYILDKKKLLFVLSMFEKIDLKRVSEPEIFAMLKKHKLLDEVFLSEISLKAENE